MTLINGDCKTELKKIPDKSIDSIITDPPYEVKVSSGGGVYKGKVCIYQKRPQ